MVSRLYITDDISNESYAEFSRKLAKLEANPDINTVEIELSSDGGSAYAALAFCDRLSQSRLHTKVYAYGLVASAATLILACCDTRIMSPNAWAMVHEDEAAADAGARTSSIESLAKHSRRLENQWNTLMAHYTKLTAEEWSVLDKAETYLTPRECLEYGLVDEIV